MNLACNLDFLESVCKKEVDCLIFAFEPAVNQQHLENQALLQNACRGDSEAYGRLYMNYYVALVRFAWPMLGVQEDAEDAVHDAFLKSWTRLHRFDQEKGGYSTWIFAITRNCCLDRLRQRKKCGPASGFPDLELDSCPDRDVLDPAQAAIRKDRRDEVMQLIASLPEKYRETIVLFYWNELSVREIAVITKTSVSNVKSRLSRGRQQLARAFDGKISLSDDPIPSITKLLHDVQAISIANS